MRSTIRRAWREVVEALQLALAPVVIRLLLAWERLESGVAYNLTSKQVRDDPYPHYRELRVRDPVHRLRLINAWALTRYDDVDAVLRDHRRFANVGRDYGYLDYVTLLDLDPPDHTRLRSLVAQAFTRRTVAAMEHDIRLIVKELLAAVATRERFDLIQALAYPLPMIVIAKMLGVPAHDLKKFESWSNDVALVVEPVLRQRQIRQARKASDALFEYFEGIIEHRRRAPRDDLISALLAAEDAGDQLTRDELLGTLVLLLVAGNETTRNLIGNGMLALLKHPRPAATSLAAEPCRLDAAIDEMLRYDSPVQLDSRIARKDLVIRRQADSRGPADHRGARRRESGSRGLCPPRHPGYRAAGDAAPGIRTRDPLLPRVTAGDPRSPPRVRRPPGTVQRDSLGPRA